MQGRCGSAGWFTFSMLVLIFLADASVAAAQRRSGSTTHDPADLSSAYLPLGHWVYVYLDVLVARGTLEGLPVLVQPYRRVDVAAAVLKAEGRPDLDPVVRGWLDEIERELSIEVGKLAGTGPAIAMHGQVDAGFEAVSQPHRDLLRPEGDEKLFLTLGLELRGDAPAVAGALRLDWNNHYLNDPQFPDGRAIERRQCDPFVDDCAYRVEDAYVELQVPYVMVFFGRMERNWGLPGRDGLLLSAYAYSYDHIGYRFGNERISLTGLYAPFNDFAGDTARHFSSHRFDWRIRDNLAVSVSESVVYGGENRRIQFNLTNPVGIWEISGSPRGDERNSMGGGEVWWRPWTNLIAYGAFLVDNTSVGDEEQGKNSGFNQFAAAFGLQLPRLGPHLALRGDLTVANALAYRSRVDFFEYYAAGQAGYGIGLAQDKTDVILVTLDGEWFPRRRLVLAPRLQFMWKGEDDLTDPWPEDAFTRPGNLLIGTIERQIRGALAGRYHAPYGEVRWDLGLNLIKNRDHEARDWEVEFVGSLWAEVRYGF